MDEEGEQQSWTHPSLSLRMAIRTLSLVVFLVSGNPLCGQDVNGTQQVLRQGLRTSSGYGSFTASAYAPDGSLYLLLASVAVTSDCVFVTGTTFNSTFPVTASGIQR